MASYLDRSRGRCGPRHPVVVYAHDENLVERQDPAEKLHQEIQALDEENRKLLDSISDLRGEKQYSFGEWPTAKKERPCAVRKPIVITASCAAPVSTRYLSHLKVFRAPQTTVATTGAHFQRFVASNPSSFNPTAPRSFPPSPVVSRAASPSSVRLQSVQQQPHSRSPSPPPAVALVSPTASAPGRSPSSPQAVLPVATTASAPGLSPSPPQAALPVATTASAPGQGLSPSPPQAALPVATTVSAPGSVLSEPIAAQPDWLAAATARRTAALPETPGQTTDFVEVYNKFLQAAIESTEIGAAVAALERERDQAVADAERLRASNARLEQAVAASHWGSRGLPVYAPASAACARSPAASLRTGLPQSPQLSPRPAALRSPAASQRGSYPARPPSEEISACFQKGWRYFHQQQQRQDSSKEDSAAATIRRASDAMLKMEPGRDSSVGTIWREALLEGALNSKQHRANLHSEASPKGASGTESDPETPG